MLKAQELATRRNRAALRHKTSKALPSRLSSCWRNSRKFLAGNMTLSPFAAGATHFSAADMADFELEARGGFSPAFAALHQLKAELGDETPASDTTIDDLQKAADHILDYHAQVGARTNRLEALQNRLTVLEHDLAVRRSADEEVDFAGVMITLREEEMAYQAALSITARIMQVSLVDFL